MTSTIQRQPLKRGEKQTNKEELDPTWVYCPNAIQIYGVSGVHRDTIELAVESELTGVAGDLASPEVKHVQIFEEKNMVLVTLCDYQGT